MNNLTITRKSSDAGLAEDIRQDAVNGVVLTPEYVVVRRDALQSLMDNAGLVETLRILSNPADADGLRAAIAEIDAGEYVEADLIEDK